MTEDQIQRSIVDYCRAVLPRHITFAVPNGSRRTMFGRAGNAVAGLMPGIPDLCIIAPLGQAYFLEVKSGKGPLSDAQKDVHALFALRGIPYAIVRSIDDVRVAFAAWKLETREADPDIKIVEL